MSGTPAAPAAAPADDGDTQARQIVDEAAARYCAARRAKIDDFVDRTFSLSGTLRSSIAGRSAGISCARRPIWPSPPLISRRA